MAHYANIISFNDVKAASRSRFAQSRDGERNVFEEEEAAPVEEEPEIRELEDEVPAVEEAAEAAPAGETESAEEAE